MHSSHSRIQVVLFVVFRLLNGWSDFWNHVLPEHRASEERGVTRTTDEHGHAPGEVLWPGQEGPRALGCRWMHLGCTLSSLSSLSCHGVMAFSENHFYHFSLSLEISIVFYLFYFSLFISARFCHFHPLPGLLRQCIAPGADIENCFESRELAWSLINWSL